MFTLTTKRNALKVADEGVSDEKITKLYSDR